jgi:hypothetical protein
LQQAARGRLDIEVVAQGLHAAGIEDDVPQLVAALTAEAADHAARVTLEKQERRALTALDRPLVELPWLADGIDLSSLYALAEALERQGLR